MIGRLNQQQSRRRRWWWWCTETNSSCRWHTWSMYHFNAWSNKIEEYVWGILKRKTSSEKRAQAVTTTDKHSRKCSDTWPISFCDLFGERISYCIISHATVNQNKGAATVGSNRSRMYKCTHRQHISFIRYTHAEQQQQSPPPTGTLMRCSNCHSDFPCAQSESTLFTLADDGSESQCLPTAHLSSPRAWLPFFVC